MVAGCALGRDVCHWMLKEVNMVQGQQDGPLTDVDLLFLDILFTVQNTVTMSIRQELFKVASDQQIDESVRLTTQELQNCPTRILRCLKSSSHLVKSSKVLSSRLIGLPCSSGSSMYSQPV